MNGIGIFDSEHYLAINSARWKIAEAVIGKLHSLNIKTVEAKALRRHQGSVGRAEAGDRARGNIGTKNLPGNPPGSSLI